MHLLVNIDVDDLDHAIRFYTTAFDLTCQRLLFGGSVAELAGAESSIYLLTKPAGTPCSAATKAERNYNRHWTPVHLDFVVEDVVAAVERAVAAGALLEGSIQTFAWGQHAELSDPFGHGFCLIQFNQQGYAAAP